MSPSGPKLQIEFENEFPGSVGPGPKKSKTESKKSQNCWKIVDFDSFSTPFWTFLGPEAERAQKTHFPTLFATLGPKGPNDPCSGQKFSQGSPLKLKRGVRISDTDL